MLILRKTIVTALIFLGCFTIQAANVRIIKVLPHYLDLDGREALSPSLYERDAYQALLRKNPDLRSALRFDIQWKAGGIKVSHLNLRLELRTSKNALVRPLILEQPVKKRRWFSSWSSLLLSGPEFKDLGNILAWRATLWDGEKMIAEKKSFLW